MYTLLQMNFSRTTNPINEAIRLGLLAFCSHTFLQRRGIRLPNDYLYKNYRTCFEDINTQPPRGGKTSSQWISLWFLMIGKISIFTSDTDADDDSVPWIKSSLRENLIDLIGLNKNYCSWPQLRLILKSRFLWIDILHDGPGKMIFESVYY